MCQCLSERRDYLGLQKCLRDVKYSLGDTVLESSMPMGFCVHLMSSELLVGSLDGALQFACRVSCRCMTRDAWLEETA